MVQMRDGDVGLGMHSETRRGALTVWMRCVKQQRTHGPIQVLRMSHVLAQKPVRGSAVEEKSGVRIGTY